MKKTDKMEFIYEEGEKKVSIDRTQRAVRENVINRYKEARKGKKISQAELAKRTGIRQPNIARFESGNYNPTLEMMVRMAEALDMTIEINLTEKAREY